MQSSRAVLPVHDTPFSTTSTVIPDRRGAEQLIVILKASFDIGRGGKLSVAEEQDPIALCDQHRGDPGSTSIAHSGEVHPPKPLGTDVLLVGHAIADKSGTTDAEVRLAIANVDKRAVVLGNRAWHTSALGAAAATGPEPWTKVPLVYENAFGGIDDSPLDEGQREREPRNPVGRGFRARASTSSWERTLLPNLEHPEGRIQHPDDRPPPIGFGPIGRHWEPRVQYVGTYDEAWLRERNPLLPEDFDERFHHAAPPDQIVKDHVRGGEALTVTGCTRSGPVVVEIPRVAANVEVAYFRRDDQAALTCDTLVIDTDRMKLNMIMRASFSVGADLLSISKVALDVEGVPQ